MSKIRNYIIALLGLGVAIGAPVVPTATEWQQSYETVAFITPDKDLGIGEYAVRRSGGWFVRDVPKNEGNFRITNDASEIVGKTEVQILCEACAAYEEFLTPAGKKIRIKIGVDEYHRLRTVKNYPKPDYTTRESILSGIRAEAAITFEGTSTQINTSASSLSFSHTNTSGSVLVGVASVESGALSDFDYNTVNLTASVSTSDATGEVEIWYLDDPSTGSNTVTVTNSATTEIAATVISLVGAGSGGPEATKSESFVFGSGTDQSYSTTSITTLTDNAWVVTGVEMPSFDNDCIDPFTADAGDTQREYQPVDSMRHGVTTVNGVTPAGAVTTGFSTICDFDLDSNLVSAAFGLPTESDTPAPPPVINGGALNTDGGAVIIE